MDIYNLAVANDPQYKASQASLAAAKEALPQSTANFLPTLNASASHVKDFDSDTDSFNRYSIALKQSIYEHGNFVERRSAESFVAQAEANFHSDEQSLVFDVATAYLTVLAFQDNLEFAEAEKASNARQLDQTKQRFDVGLVAITDVHESQAAYDISVARSIEAQNLLDSTRERLRELTGSYHEDLDVLGKELPLLPPSPDNLQAWTDMALNQSPNLQAAIHATERAKEDVNAQRSDNYPSVDLTVLHSDNDRDDLEITDSTSAVLGVSVSLYRGGLTQSYIKQAREFLRQSRENQEETRRAVQRVVRNAYRSVLSGISRVKALKQAVVSSESALRAAEAGYEVGTRTTVDVLVARRNLFSAERDYAKSRYDFILDNLRLHQAAGSLTADNLKTYSDLLR